MIWCNISRILRDEALTLASHPFSHPSSHPSSGLVRSSDNYLMPAMILLENRLFTYRDHLSGRCRRTSRSMNHHISGRITLRTQVPLGGSWYDVSRLCNHQSRQCQPIVRAWWLDEAFFLLARDRFFIFFFFAI